MNYSKDVKVCLISVLIIIIIVVCFSLFVKIKFNDSKNNVINENVIETSINLENKNDNTWKCLIEDEKIAKIEKTSKSNEYEKIYVIGLAKGNTNLICNSYENENIVSTKKFAVVVDNKITITESNNENIVNQDEIKNNLLNIKDSNLEYINENNASVLLKDNLLSTGEKLEIDKYAFVDFDDDGYDELIILTTSNAGLYYILHYSKSNSTYYGYEASYRSLEEIKIDGSSMGSGGASYSVYSNGIIFDGTTMNINIFAEYDTDEKIYRINGIDVEENEVQSYVKSFDSKQTLQFN